MSRTTEIELTGLTGSSPIGALAAFGLLRLCAEIEVLSQTKLGWRRRDDWFAVLSLSGDINKEALVALLSEHLRKQPTDVFEWHQDGRELPNAYKTLLRSAVESASWDQRRKCDFFAAFASEMAVDSTDKELIKPTAFYMTSARQQFLSTAQKLAKAYRKDQPEKLNEALFGPWLYRDQQHALGWDPAAERIHALRYMEPSKDKKNRSVNFAIRLALEALPLFPVFPDKNGRLSTSGFVRIKRENVFQWPLWQAPISLDVLKTLLTSELGDDKNLCRRGVNALYKSIRSEFGQGYGIFRPAQLVWQKH